MWTLTCWWQWWWWYVRWFCVCTYNSILFLFNIQSTHLYHCYFIIWFRHERDILLCCNQEYNLMMYQFQTSDVRDFDVLLLQENKITRVMAFIKVYLVVYVQIKINCKHRMQLLCSCKFILMIIICDCKSNLILHSLALL